MVGRVFLPILVSILIVGTMPTVNQSLISTSMVDAWGHGYLDITNTGGDCSSYGDWDQNSLTCTLTMDADKTIRLLDDDITLDGNFHKLFSSGSSGVLIEGRVNTTVENLVIQLIDSPVGNPIKLIDSNNNKIKNNIIEYSSGNVGIYLRNSHSNTIISNSIMDWAGELSNGIAVMESDENLLYGNTVVGTMNSIYLFDSEKNHLIKNWVYLSYGIGIWVKDSPYNVLIGNTATYNESDGMNLDPPVKIISNTLSFNHGWGIFVNHNPNLVKQGISVNNVCTINDLGSSYPIPLC